MPTYTYRRADGSTFDVEQRITENALDTCPTTGQPVKRLITSGAGLVFKGSGFYLTDYARKNNSSTGAEGPSSDNGKATESNGSVAKTQKEASASTDKPSSAQSS